MPAPDLADFRGRQPLTVLFWVGTALAPLAALLLVLGDSNGMLRIAAVLTLVSVVLIGLSVALRSSPDDVRRDLDDALAEEIGALRAELRQEIAAAAHGAGPALAGRLQHLQSSVEALRGEVAAGRADRERLGPRHPVTHQPGPEWERQPTQRDQAPSDDRSTGPRDPGQATGAGGQRPIGGAATYRPATRESEVRAPLRDDDERYRRSSSGPSRGAASAPAAGRGGASPPVSDRTDASGWSGAGVGWREPARDADGADPGWRSVRDADAADPAWVADRPDSGRAVPPPPRPRHGVVRHTETVHVTTRHTIVDQPGDDSGVHRSYDYRDGQVHGGHAAGRPASADDAPWPSPEPEAPWSSPEPGDRWRGAAGWDRDATAPGQHSRHDRGWGAPAPEPTSGPHVRARRTDEEEASEGDYWSSLRTGDRWASARRDDRGDEVRMGERRAAVRADATGAEFRVEDRWAAVRREGFDRSTDRGTTGPADRATGWDSSGRDRAAAPRERAEASERAEPRGRLELPAAGGDRPYAGSGPTDRHGPDGRWVPAGQPWADQGREPVRTRRDDERRYGRPPTGDMPRAGGARRPDPGFFDEGWH